jgi:hypothetical protein
MASKRIKVLLISQGTDEKGKKTNFRVVTTKLAVQKDKKLRKKRFDPRAHNPTTGKKGLHVWFEEGKLK